MNILLDTRILLWALAGHERLPDRAALLIDDLENNTIFYSIASVWETEIKNSLGKLSVSGREISDYCRQAEFKLLPIEEKHIFTLGSLCRDAIYRDIMIRLTVSCWHRQKLKGTGFLHMIL